jgi:hypothetical protein
VDETIAAALANDLHGGPVGATIFMNVTQDGDSLAVTQRQGRHHLKGFCGRLACLTRVARKKRREPSSCNGGDESTIRHSPAERKHRVGWVVVEHGINRDAKANRCSRRRVSMPFRCRRRTAAFGLLFKRADWRSRSPGKHLKRVSCGSEPDPQIPPESGDWHSPWFSALESTCRRSCAIVCASTQRGPCSRIAAVRSAVRPCFAYIRRIDGQRLSYGGVRIAFRLVGG